MGEFIGEATPRVPGEDRRLFGAAPSTVEVIKEKKLTFEEASRCLNTLGKDESGCRYAYIKLSANEMKLTDISTVLKFKHVLFLDLSGNYLTASALEVLTSLPFLIFLKAERNRVESASFSPMPYLQVLDLNQNQIKDVGNINQPLLDCLEMNHNDIYTTHFEAANLENLRQLEMRSNLLFELSGVYPANLEKLYLAANKITTINSAEFSELARLQILHLRDNNLQNLDGFSEEMRELRYINLRNNKISKFKEFRKLQCLPKLETLIVSGNPLPGTDEPQQQIAGEGGPAGDAGEGGKIRDAAIIPLLVLLPNLKRINKTLITMEERIEAEDMENDVFEALLLDEGQESDRETTTTNPTSDFKSDAEL